MKKVTLGLIGLSILISSCGPVDGSVTPPPTTNLRLNGLTYTSDWYYNKVDGSGRQYVVCDDRSTTLFLDIRWSGPLSQLTARFEGSKGGSVTRSSAFSSADYSGSTVFNTEFRPGMAPQRLNLGFQTQTLEPQAIVVLPAQKGTTFVSIQGTAPNGSSSNVITAPQGIPVVNCG